MSNRMSLSAGIALAIIFAAFWIVNRTEGAMGTTESVPHAIFSTE